MKPFSEYLKAIRGRYFTAVVFATAATAGFYMHDANTTDALTRFLGFQIGNFFIWYLLAARDMWMDVVKEKHRMRWETSMLTSIQLATAAEAYHIDNPNVLSAFHAAVQERQDEGVKLGYIELGEL